MLGHRVELRLYSPDETVSGELRRQNIEGVWIYGGFQEQAKLRFYPQHMRVFSARSPNMTYAKLGDLCCSQEEFEDLQRAMSGVEFRGDNEYPAEHGQFGVGA